MDVLEGSGSGWCVNCGNGSEWEDWGDQSLFSDTELVIVTTLCVPLLLLGLLGNALTILVVWLRPQMRSTTYLYLSSMAVSDVLILLLMPLDLYKVTLCSHCMRGLYCSLLAIVLCGSLFIFHVPLKVS